VTDMSAEQIAELIKPLRVRPGSAVRLAKDFDPGYTGDLVKKKAGKSLLKQGVKLLADYQTGSPQRTPTPFSFACRESTPPARTGHRSCHERCHPRACRSTASRCRLRRS